ncbi:hypothetical protein CEXT_281451 [Caerostris extrusa]|uniref:Uncharacterized protein n=1 Tax=Caerostris extrusa TaxID=172846 RepID=A0AAV4Y1G5_CAEEX|nr:hypothetical protein CEXT_281451 [Caerostris extrusa]
MSFHFGIDFFSRLKAQVPERMPSRGLTTNMHDWATKETRHSPNARRLTSRAGFKRSRNGHESCKRCFSTKQTSFLANNSNDNCVIYIASEIDQNNINFLQDTKGIGNCKDCK